MIEKIIKQFSLKGYSARKMAGLAFLSAFLVTILQVYAKPFDPPLSDELVYLTSGALIAQKGVFSLDAKSLETPQKTPAPNHFFMPGTAFIYAVIQAADPEFAQFSQCAALHQTGMPECQSPGWLIHTVQSLVIALAVFAAWQATVNITGSQATAWLFLIIILASGRFAHYARQFLSDGFFLLAMSLCAHWAVSFWKSPSWRLAAALALTLAFGSYIRPTMLYLFYLLMACAVFWWLIQSLRPRLNRISVAQIAMLGGLFGLLILPWMLRTHQLTGQFALTDGYAGYILVQRLAYNMMTIQEWLAAWIYWLPDFGDNLAARLFPTEAYQRLSLVEPTGFYSVGNRAFQQDMIRQAGGWEHLFPFLLAKMQNEITTHILVTFPLLLQGMWVGKLVGFACFLLSVPALFILHRRGQLFTFAVFALGPVFLLGLHAFVSVNLPRYNLALLLVMAMGAAITLAAIGQSIRRHLPGRQKPQAD
ncbi:hypothetical protein [Aestuariispira insulae]|uniref:Dolichyl-phosphate-mannose-protein mannosyltransferase n=1 Tax=Aestuariispira insulae TaxID=1461337 RepID=A0A3D9HP07_9PROT|nr:hypothetical protein [Aestuariispira insulae]RED51228.1 hypothetical protein DFP90_10325 [Aestuariispira insulae]